MPHNYCCDPLKKHKRKIIKNLRPLQNKVVINESLGQLNETSLLCVNCIKMINEQPTILKEMAANFDEDQYISSDSSISEPNLTCVTSSREEVINKEILDCVVLPTIDESPIRTRK